jgi:pimeloyl-ACP methyl ester carboxylesterase
MKCYRCQPERLMSMALIHHVVTGGGRRPIVFVHGFTCAHSAWDGLVPHLSSRHQTIAANLRGHGTSPGMAADCTVERYGADFADVMKALSLPPTVLLGHSMGCQVVVKAALKAPAHTNASSSSMAASSPLRWTPYPREPSRSRTAWFQEMFTRKSEAAVVASVVDRTASLPRSIGERLMVRYDGGPPLHFPRRFARPGETTYSNEKRERRSMTKGQTTPYRDASPTIR